MESLEILKNLNDEILQLKKENKELKEKNTKLNKASMVLEMILNAIPSDVLFKEVRDRNLNGCIEFDEKEEVVILSSKGVSKCSDVKTIILLNY